MQIVIDIPNPPSEQKIIDIPIHFCGGQVVDAGGYGFEERKTGKWIVEEIGLRRYATKCSVCGTLLHEGYNFDNAQEYKEYIDGLGCYDKFCHECGAKMEIDE